MSLCAWRRRKVQEEKLPKKSAKRSIKRARKWRVKIHGTVRGFLLFQKKAEEVEGGIKKLVEGH